MYLTLSDTVFAVLFLYDDEPSALKRFLMRANGRKPWGKSWVQLSKCESEWLNKSRFFNPNQPFFDRFPRN